MFLFFFYILDKSNFYSENPLSEFAHICESSTDFHFPTLERQYELIEQQLPKATEIRAQKRLASGDDGDQASLHSSSSGGSSEDKVGHLLTVCSGEFWPFFFKSV